MIQVTLLVPFSSFGKEITLDREGLTSTAEVIHALGEKLGKRFIDTLLEEDGHVKDSVMILSGGRNISSSFKAEPVHSDYTFCSVISGG